MGMKELENQIEQELSQYGGALLAWKSWGMEAPERVHSLKEETAVRILALIEETGYVKLAADQSLPQQSYASQAHIGSHSSQGYVDSQQDMLKAEWRKVELER